ncbi:Protein AIM2 [Elsinoe australis]|uniref:Protein AIM2 n=1 Tax=Elsinoe australis TaxID=40998 RepID=A0A2P7Z1E8_9PEZI|nr:Protein AIM2 [Elsinoe australis]
MHFQSSILCTLALVATAFARGPRGSRLGLVSGPPAGTIRPIANGSPAHSEIGVVFLTDIFGINFNNSQLVADSFGAQGYYTFMPDLFRGEPVPVDRPADFDFPGWQARNQPAAIDPIIDLTLQEVLGNTNVKRVGIVGYCFGGKYVARWLGRNAGIAAGYTAHPSNVAPEEWSAVTEPLSIANAELDSTWPLEEARIAESILRDASIAWQLNTFSDVPHGFAIRANDSLPRQVFAKEQAFVQAVNWFGEYVKPANTTRARPASRKSYGSKSFAEEHAAVVAD